MSSLYRRLARPGSLWFEASDPAGPYGDSLLFSDPVASLPLFQADDILEWFGHLESWRQAGFCLAGWLSYEAGIGLDPALSTCARGGGAELLGWFGAYRQPERFSREEVAEADDEASASAFGLSGLEFDLPEAEYFDRIRQIRSEIASGNVYQVNFTGRFRFGFQGAPEALYCALKRRQPSSWSAFLNTGERTILSFSPELFFRLEGGLIEMMPMKGTAPRRDDAEADGRSRLELAGCEKNRAENLMIVDLLRNDLGRICESGSVEVPSLFETQTYPTLHQMVSTVNGRLIGGTTLYELFRALFPSGSITGAPKVSAMKLIRSMEKSPRGAYTGTMGFFLPEGRAAFNVAIRTVELAGDLGVYGTGSGIVWDSDPLQEYRECMLKARILSDTLPSAPALFETMLWNGAWLLFDDHLDRLSASASALGFVFDEEAVLASLSGVEPRLKEAGGPHRVRLSIDRTGKVSVVSEPFAPDPSGRRVRVCIADERVRSQDPMLRHKTTERGIYERGLQAAASFGCGDALFLNERDELTEGAISNVLVRLDGRWYTPPESSGLLNGVYRRYLLRTRPWIAERTISREELLRAEAIVLCNALRGSRRAELIVPEGQEAYISIIPQLD